MGRPSIGSLWERESKKGAKYFGGTLRIGEDRIKVVMLRNGYKGENERQPDWYIYEQDKEGA